MQYEYKMRRETIKLIFHIVVVLFFIVTWKGIVDLRGTLKDMRKVQSTLLTRFLTNWNFFFQTLLFIGYLIHDVFESLGREGGCIKRMKRIIDFCFYSVIAPTSIFISIVFWGMTAYDNTLIIPEGLHKFLPAWLNHALHTVIVLTVIVHAYFNRHPLTEFLKAAIASAVFYLFYFLCIYETYYEVNVWIYPFVGRLDEPYRMLFLLVLLSIFSAISITFNFANKLYCNRTKPHSHVN